MSRVLIEGTAPNGAAFGVIVPTMDLDRMDWTDYLRPLADLLAECDVTWVCTPIPDDQDDRKAMGVG